MNFTIKIAGKIVQLNRIYPDLKLFCQDYLIPDTTPDFSLCWSEDDIRMEQKSVPDEDTYSPQYLETLTALRKISETLPVHHRMLMHGAAITCRDDAFLFTAPSGTGKSTHTWLWRKYLASDVDIINADKPILSVDAPSDASGCANILVHGTP